MINEVKICKLYNEVDVMILALDEYIRRSD